jgi:formate hydrogenlyase subunit 4
VLHSILTLVASLVGVVLAPVYDGLERKLRAAIHTRIGPPVLQTWYDLVKLFSKELVIPEGGTWCVLTLALEITALVASIALLNYIPLVTIPGVVGVEVAAFIALLTVATALTMVRAVAQNNVYSVVGGFREFTLALSSEPFLVFSYLALVAGGERPVFRISSLLILTICAYVLSSRIPYDIAEAEPELSAGVNIELAGPLLGVATMSTVLRRFLAAELTALALVSTAGFWSYQALVLSLALTPAVWVVHALVSILLGRTRVDVGPRTLLLTLFPLSVVTITIYGLGL